MKIFIVSLVIITPLIAVPYRIKLTKCNLPFQQKRALSAATKEILASIKPHQASIFTTYLECEKMIHLLRDSEKQTLNELLKKKLFLEEELKKNPEFSEPYKRFTTAIHNYFTTLAHNMFAPTKKLHRLYSNDPTDQADAHEKETLHHIAQQINTDMENFKDTCVKECLYELTNNKHCHNKLN